MPSPNRKLTRPAPGGRSDDVQAALFDLGMRGGAEERGAVYTRSEVVVGILDLCGYTEDRDLFELRLLEPSFGDGHFLLPAVARLIDSCTRCGIATKDMPRVLINAVSAVELHQATFDSTRARLINLLRTKGISAQGSLSLADHWLHQDDFLLADLSGLFDIVIGNPPYVRQERIPKPLLKEYKARFSTLYDRADLYVLFYERGLDLLVQGGVLGFICANRWIKNKYGGPLREKVAGAFHLELYINLEGGDAFQEQVDAYPAITIIRRATAQSTKVIPRIQAPQSDITTLVQCLCAPPSKQPRTMTEIHGLMNGRDPWLLDSPEILALVRALEAQFPTLEQDDAKVGIGVATGCDQVYIGQLDSLPVEEARTLPLAIAADLQGCEIAWSGQGLVNPWLQDGRLAPLEEYPRFAAYLEQHQDQLRARHTARKSPKRWYKTIDRVHLKLTHTPKLLIPDIKGNATVAYDEGAFYPHHNLYVITSERWDLEVLQAILRSSIALMFVAAYSVRMAGGFLRFQAQYLRRIRIPAWCSLKDSTKHALRNVARETNQDTLDSVVHKAYGLHSRQSARIREFAGKARIKASS